MAEEPIDMEDRLCDCPDAVDAVAERCPVHNYDNFRTAQKAASEGLRERDRLRARIEELEGALEGLVAEVDDRSYKEGCGCDWCGSIRRARRALESEDMPTTDDALETMHRAFTRLTELGWHRIPSGRAKKLAKEWGNVEVVTAGSTGIFPAQCDDQGRWWVEDGGEVWPARPILWREPADPATERERDTA